MNTIILIILNIIQITFLYFIYQRLRVIEVTKEVMIVSKPKDKKPFTPIIIKPKTGVGNHIINEMKHEQSRT